MDMSVVLTQMGILVFIMLVGFVCAKLKITGPEFNKYSSSLVMNVLLVFTILHSFTSTDMEMSFSQIAVAVGAFTVLLAICFVLGLVVARILKLRGDQKGLAVSLVFFPNTAFIAFPLIEAIYGAEGLLVASLANIPFNLLLYTVGTSLVSGSGEGMNLKSALSAPFVATVAAVIFFLSGLKLPEPVVQAFGTLGRATAPMSMLIVGTSLGGVALNKVFTNWRVYVLSFARLIVSPILVWFILKWFIADKMLMDIIVIVAAAPAAMMLSIFAITYEKDEVLASQSVFISTVFCAATVPFIMWLLL